MIFKKSIIRQRITRKAQQALVGLLCFLQAFPVSVFAVRYGEGGDVLIEARDPRLERLGHFPISRAVKILPQHGSQKCAFVPLEDFVVGPDCAVVFSGAGRDSIFTQVEGEYPSFLRGQIIGQAGENLVVVNPHGFHVQEVPFQNLEQVTLIAADVEEEDYRRFPHRSPLGTGQVILEGVSLDKRAGDVQTFLGLSPTDIKQFAGLGTAVQIRRSHLITTEGIHLKALKSSTGSSSGPVIEMDAQSQIDTPFLRLESLEQGRSIVLPGTLKVGKEGLTLQAQGDVILGPIDSQGPVTIKTTGKVIFTQQATFQASISIVADSIETQQDVIFQAGARFQTRDGITLRGKTLIQEGIRVECGGDWSILGAVIGGGKIEGRVAGNLRQEASVHVEAGVEILTHTYEKRASLTSSQDVHIRVQDSTILTGAFEKGLLETQGPLLLRGITEDQPFINNGTLHGSILETFSELVNNGHIQGKIHRFTQQQGIRRIVNNGIFNLKEMGVQEGEDVFNTGVVEIKNFFLKKGQFRSQTSQRAPLSYRNRKGRYVQYAPGSLIASEKAQILTEEGTSFVSEGIFYIKILEAFSGLINNGHIQGDALHFVGPQKNRGLINNGILDLAEARIEGLEEILNTGVMDVSRVFLKGGQLVSRKNHTGLLRYTNRHGQTVQYETGSLIAQEKIEAFPFYKFIDGYTPDFTRPDAIRPEVLETYKPFHIYVEEGLFQTSHLILHDYGGKFDSFWDPHVLEDTNTAYIHPRSATPPVLSSFEIRGGTVQAKKLSLQVQYMNMDPWGQSQKRPLLEFEEVDHFNIAGGFRNQGTISYKGTSPLIFNFLPKVVGYVYLGSFDHRGEVTAPYADVSVLGHSFGKGYFHAKNFFYMPYFEKEGRLYSLAISEEGVPYTHLLHLPDIQVVIAPESQRVTAGIEVDRQRIEQERAQREAQIRAQEVATRQMLEGQIAHWNGCIAGEAGERDKIVRIDSIMVGFKRNDLHQRTNIAVYRSAQEKAPYNQRIGTYQGQINHNRHFIDHVLPAETAGQLAQVNQAKAQEFQSLVQQWNEQVAAIMRRIEGERAQQLEDFRRFLGDTAKFEFTVQADTCRYGVCALDLQGLILAKVEADFSSVIDLRTGGDFSQSGRAFVEALSRITEQGVPHASSSALALVESPSPLLRNLARVFEQLGFSVGAGDILSPSIHIGGARAMLNARTGLWGLTQDIRITAQTLALMAMGSLETQHADMDSQVVVNAGQMTIGHLRSEVGTLVDMGGDVRIGQLELLALPYILRITGALHVSQPMILAARHLVQLLKGARIHVDSHRVTEAQEEAPPPVGIQAPHIETGADVTVTGDAPLVVNAQSTFVQTGGILQADRVEVFGPGTAALTGGQILGETVVGVATPVVYQIPGHRMEADVVAVQAEQSATLRGETVGRQRIQLDVPSFDLRDTDFFRTPLAEILLQEDLNVHMPTVVGTAVHVETQGAVNVTQPLFFQELARIVAKKSSSVSRTGAIRGKKGLSLILVGQDTTLYNKGQIHDDAHLRIDGNVESKKVIRRTAGGQYVTELGGDITSNDILELHGGYHRGILSVVAAPHTWIDYGEYYSSGVTEGRKMLVFDATRATFERTQAHWQETVYTTTKKRGFLGSSKTTHARVVNRVESYPVHMSGAVNAGMLVADSRVDVSSIFPRRATRDTPYIERLSLKGGTFTIGKGGMHLRTRDHIEVVPNVDNRVLLYTIGKSGFFGGHQESGAVMQEHAVPVRIQSEGPVYMRSEGTMWLPGLQVESTGVGEQGAIDITARGDIELPGLKVRVEHVPTLKTRKGLIYQTTGYHEEAVISMLRGDRLTVHSEEGTVRGVRPQITSFNTDTILAGGLPEEQAGARVSFTPLTLLSDERTQVVGTTGDPRLASLASLAATLGVTLATGGAGAFSLASLFEVTGVGSVMVNAAAVSLAGQTASALVMNGGNIGDTFSSLGSVDTLRSVATSVATAGLTRGLTNRLGASPSDAVGELARNPLVTPISFGEFAQRSLLRAGVTFAVDATIGGRGVEEALQGSARYFAVNTVQGFGAYHVGQAFNEGQISGGMQLGAHTILGGMGGALLNPDDWRSGAFSGAAGSLAAEGAVKLLGYEDAAHTRQQILNDMEEAGEPLTQSGYDNRLEDTLHRQAEFARFVGSLGAFGLGLDMGVASTTAAIALENNFTESQRAQHAKLSAQREVAGVEEGDELDRAVGSLEEFMESHREGHKISYTVLSGMSSSDLLWSSSGLTRGSQSRPSEHIQRQRAIVDDMKRALVTERDLLTRASLMLSIQEHSRMLRLSMAGEHIGQIAHTPIERLERMRRSVAEYTEPQERSVRSEIERMEDIATENPMLMGGLEDSLWTVRLAHSTVEHAPHMVPVTPLEIGEVGLTLLPVMGSVTRVGGVALRGGTTLGIEIGSLIRGTGSVSRRLMGEVRQSRMAQSIERFFVGSEPRLEDVLRPIGRFQSDGTVIPFTPAELESLLPKVGIASRAQTVPMFDTNKSVVQAIAEQSAIKVQVKKTLLKGEGGVGIYRELKKQSIFGDNLTPNHIPQAAYMRAHGVAYDDGICMMMEHPFPGTGGRHRLTRTYGRQPDLTVISRDELALDIWDIRQIYKADGVYTSDIRQALQEIIKRSKQARPDLFIKKAKEGTQ